MLLVDESSDKEMERPLATEASTRPGLHVVQLSKTLDGKSLLSF